MSIRPAWRSENAAGRPAGTDGCLLGRADGNMKVVRDMLWMFMNIMWFCGGRDFAAGTFLPQARYCLDTTLQKIAAGTYRDDTGTIKM